jgi:hypothetical protein
MPGWSAGEDGFSLAPALSSSLPDVEPFQREAASLPLSVAIRRVAANKRVAFGVGALVIG